MSSWQAPDGLEPVLAARLWVLRGDDLTLRSLVKPVVWPTDGPLHATCTAPLELRADDHEAPSESCYCGFWGLPLPGRLDEVELPQPEGWKVGGVAKLWGRILVGTRGWRAEWARPTALIVPNRRRSIPIDLLQSVAARYGLILLNEWPTLTPLAA